MRALWAQLAALLAFLCTRMALLSASPLSGFPDVCSASIAISVPIFATMWLRDRRARKAFTSPAAESRKTPSRQPAKSSGLCKPLRDAPWVRTGLLLGAVYFMTHFLFTGHGVLARYVDVPPFPSGAAVILLLGLGVLAGRYTLFWASPVAVVYGIGAMLLFVYVDGYAGLLGGLLLAMMTGAMWPLAVANVQRCPPGRTLLVALLVHFVGILGSVWVVAYNFVPFGGEHMRESPQYVVFTFTVTMICAALLLADRHFPRGTTTLRGRAALLLMLVLAVGLSVSMSLRLHSAPQLTAHHHHPITSTEWLPRREVWPARANTTDLNAMIWTIHFGYDNHGILNFQLIENVIRTLDMDVVRVCARRAPLAVLLICVTRSACWRPT
jgi:hypothetical protein